MVLAQKPRCQPTIDGAPSVAHNTVLAGRILLSHNQVVMPDYRVALTCQFLN